MNCEDPRPIALSLKKGLTNIRKGYYYVKVLIILFVDEGKDDSRLISHVTAAPLRQVYKLSMLSIRIAHHRHSSVHHQMGH